MKTVMIAFGATIVFLLAAMQSFELGQKATPVVQKAASEAWENVTNEEKVKRLEAVLAKCEVAAEEWKTKKAALETLCKSQQDKIEDLASTVNQYVKLYDETSAKLEQANNEAAALRAENTRLVTKVEVLEKRLAALDEAESRLVVDLLK